VERQPGRRLLWTRGKLRRGRARRDDSLHLVALQILLDDADPSVGPIRQYGNIGGRLYANLSAPASLAPPSASARGASPAWSRRLRRLPKTEIPIVRLSRVRLLLSAFPFMVGRMSRNADQSSAVAGVPSVGAGRSEALCAKIQAASSTQELTGLWDSEVCPIYA